MSESVVSTQQSSNSLEENSLKSDEGTMLKEDAEFSILKARLSKPREESGSLLESILNSPSSSEKKNKYSSRSCAILNCPNPSGTSYHFFPSDEALRRAWIDLCDLKKSFNPKRSRICGRHFSDDAFMYNSIRERLIPKSSLRRRLRTDALPSIAIKDETSSLLDKVEKPSIQYIEVVGNDPQSSLDLQGEPDSVVEVISTQILPPIQQEPQQCKLDKCKNLLCQNEVRSYKTKIRKLQRILKRERKDKKRDINKLVMEKLGEKGHSRSQINFLMGKTNRPGNFSKDEVADFIVLRTISLKAYKFLREKKLMCLPAPSTLHNWVKVIK